MIFMIALRAQRTFLLDVPGVGRPPAVERLQHTTLWLVTSLYLQTEALLHKSIAQSNTCMLLVCTRCKRQEHTTNTISP